MAEACQVRNPLALALLLLPLPVLRLDAACAPAALPPPPQVSLQVSGDLLPARSTMCLIAMGLTGVAAFLPVFVSERVVYWREASALPQPLQTVAYFIGKDLAMVPQTLLAPAFFTLMYSAMCFPRDSFGDVYVILLGAYWCGSAYGYVVGVLAPPSLAQLLGVVVVFVSAVFSGRSFDIS